MPYGEILRTLGRRLDARGWGSLRLDARAAHLVLEARPVARWGPPERLVLTPAALVRLLRETRGSRGADGVATAVPRHPVGLGYGEALRLIGQDLDRRGARLVRVIEHPDGLIVQEFPPGAGLTTVLASWPRLMARLRLCASPTPTPGGARRMTEIPPRYRTLDRPGPGLATIAEPDGREGLWSRNQRGARLRLCAQCGTMTAPLYRPALVRGPSRPHLCRPCVEGVADA